MDDRTILGALHVARELAPHKQFLRFVDGATYTPEHTATRAAKFAGLMSTLGVGPGDRIAILVSNRFEYLEAVFGSAHLGAVSVPLNTSLRGPILEHMLRDADPSAILVEPQFAAVATAALTALRGVISPIILVVGDTEPGYLDYTAAINDAPAASPARITPYDNACIMYTSGTTGPSKGVLHTHESIVAFGDKAQWLFNYQPADVAHNCLPLFHANAMCVTLLPSIRAGASAVFGSRFSASGFWPELRAQQATVTSILGAMVPILWGAPVSDLDAQHSVRVALSVPTPSAEIYEAFEKRFNMRLVSQYGMTDTSIVIGTPPEAPGRPGYAGVEHPDFECVVADEHDQPVPDGTAGELLVRPRRPGVMMKGYWRNDAATVEVTRNLWFHTGDVLVREPDGWFKFLDRKKDAMRRFGENISSFEVEEVIAMHPSVEEVAVYAVPAELSEDEVMAAIVFRPGHPADLVDIGRHCDQLLPYFASPRFLTEVSELPKTSNQKVRKEILRSNGITQSTVDRGPRGRAARQKEQT